MAKRSGKERLEALAAKKKALLEKMAEEERRIKSQVSKEDREADTHLKVLYGAAVKALIEDPSTDAGHLGWLKAAIDKKLTKDRDKELVRNHQRG